MEIEAKAIRFDALESSLRAVLAWYERPVSASSLRSRVAHHEGFWTEETLFEAADSLGLDIEESLIDPVLPVLPRLPAICVSKEGGAFVVLSQLSENQILVVDTAVQEKPTEMTVEELWSRLAGQTFSLLLRPEMQQGNKEFAQGTSPWGRHGHWFWGPILKARWVYLQVALAALLINIFAIASSVFSMIVYDRVIPNNATDTLIALLIGVSIVFISDFFIRSLRSYFLDMASARADSAIADSLFEQILDVQMHARRGSTGALASTLKEFEQIRDFLTSATLITFIDIPFSVLFLLIIFLIGGPMVWVPLLAVPVILLAGLGVQPKLKKLIKQSQEDGHHKHAILVETLAGLETIKALGAGSIMRRRWQEAVSHQSHIGLKSRMFAQFAANVANTAQQFVQVGVVAVGALLVHEGHLGMGAIIACTILSGRAIAPLAQITQLLSKMNQTLTSYRALEQLMSQEREHRYGQVFMQRNAFKGEIEFRNVSFSYPGSSRPVLDGISFKIAAGEKVAIVGKVGSGKTTVSKLLLGLYRPSEGSVLIDGIDVRQIDPADLRQAMGVVLQEVWLMGGTVRQNIALGAEHPTDDEILKAAYIAGVEDFIKQHPEGYGLRLGERGEGLSGGQRQAVSVARALVGNPSVVVFDEATSAMDSGAEAALIQRLKQHLSHATFVTITHKGALMQLVERLIVIDQGKVVAQGAPDQLMRAAQQQSPVASPHQPVANS